MPRQRKLLFLLFGILAFLTALDLAGIAYYLYWRFFWYDIPAHILGGVCVALGAAWLLSLREKMPTFVFCVGVTLCVGVLWEIFEAYFRITEFPRDTLDTVKDLCDDTLGGIAGMYLARLISRS